MTFVPRPLAEGEYDSFSPTGRVPSRITDEGSELLQKVQASPKLDEYAARENQKHQQVLHNLDLANMRRDSVPSNIDPADINSDDNQDGETETFADRGMSVVEGRETDPDTGRPIPAKKRDEFTEGGVPLVHPKWSEINEADTSVDESQSDLDSTDRSLDLEELFTKAKKFGINISDILDPDDMRGNDLSVILSMLQNEITRRELSGGFENLTLVTPDKNHLREIIFAPERIQDNRIRTFIEKTLVENPNFLNDLWRDASSVRVTLDPKGGPARISVETNEVRDTKQSEKQNERKKPNFIFMDLNDFFAMCSVPEVNEGESRVSNPEIKGNTLKDYMNLFATIENLLVNGKAIGSEKHPFYKIGYKNSTENSDDELWSIPEVGPTIWHDSAPDDVFDKPGYPEDYAKANNQKRGY